ncbi:Uncharacterized protein QTN25_003391 [Entamoeba marina]
MAISQRKNKFTQAKRISVSFEGEQETVLMAILCQYGISFTIQCPRKRSDTCQFVDIKNITIENQTYDLVSYIEHMIVESGKQIDQSEKNYMKYNKRNHIAATNNLLIDLVELLGWRVHLKNSKDAEVTLKMKRINVLSIGSNTITGEDISAFGMALNTELKNYVKGNKRDTPVIISAMQLPITNYVQLCLPPFTFSPLHQLLCPQVSNQIDSDDDNETCSGFDQLPPGPLISEQQGEAKLDDFICGTNQLDTNCYDVNYGDANCYDGNYYDTNCYDVMNNGNSVVAASVMFDYTHQNQDYNGMFGEYGLHNSSNQENCGFIQPTQYSFLR